MSSYIPLHDGWSVTPVAGPDVPPPVAAEPVPATVPGCVHTDLLAAGPDPRPVPRRQRDAAGLDRPHRLGLRDHLRLARRRTPTGSTWSATGLDTVATVDAQRRRGRPDREHAPRLPLRRPGRAARRRATRCEVRFDSAVRVRRGAAATRSATGPTPYAEPFNFIRKMACNFGWDWGPTLVTAGIWQPIGLHSWSTARLAEVRPLVTVDGGDGPGRGARRPRAGRRRAGRPSPRRSPAVDRDGPRSPAGATAAPSSLDRAATRGCGGRAATATSRATTST